MLTGNLLRVRYTRDRIVPVYLDVQDEQWLRLAEQLLGVFRLAAGSTRGEIEAEIDELFGDQTQPQIHLGLVKLLEDRSEFEAPPGHPPHELRDLAFRAAAAARQQGAFDRAAVLQGVGASLGLDAAQVEAGLFADLKTEQRLARFDDITPRRLLEHYNVALAQAVLLRATRVVADLAGETPQRYRALFRKAKFHRLICSLEKIATGYRMVLDGPLSLFSATQRYGLQLALFLPALLHCEQFRLTADLVWGPTRRAKVFTLDSREGLVPTADSTGTYVPVEVAMFVEQFRKKAVAWDLVEETEVIEVGRQLWVPDFVLVHRTTQARVALDLLGFWRRSSVEKQLALLRQAERPFLLALWEQFQVDEDTLSEWPEQVIRFRSTPLVDEVILRAERLLQTHKTFKNR